MAVDGGEQQRSVSECPLPREHEARTQEWACGGAIGQLLPFGVKCAPRFAGLLDASLEFAAVHQTDLRGPAAQSA